MLSEPDNSALGFPGKLPASAAAVRVVRIASYRIHHLVVRCSRQLPQSGMIWGATDSMLLGCVLPWITTTRCHMQALRTYGAVLEPVTLRGGRDDSGNMPGAAV